MKMMGALMVTLPMTWKNGDSQWWQEAPVVKTATAHGGKTTLGKKTLQSKKVLAKNTADGFDRMMKLNAGHIHPKKLPRSPRIWQHGGQTNDVLKHKGSMKKNARD
jgi:hypothetical protein